jgi:hypothetical protein
MVMMMKQHHEGDEDVVVVLNDGLDQWVSVTPSPSTDHFAVGDGARQ